jgi:hypothetical protein
VLPLLHAIQYDVVVKYVLLNCKESLYSIINCYAFLQLDGIISFLLRPWTYLIGTKINTHTLPIKDVINYECTSFLCNKTLINSFDLYLVDPGPSLPSLLLVSKEGACALCSTFTCLTPKRKTRGHQQPIN